MESKKYNANMLLKKIFHSEQRRSPQQLNNMNVAKPADVNKKITNPNNIIYINSDEEISIEKQRKEERNNQINIREEIEKEEKIEKEINFTFDLENFHNIEKDINVFLDDGNCSNDLSFQNMNFNNKLEEKNFANFLKEERKRMRIIKYLKNEQSTKKKKILEFDYNQLIDDEEIEKLEKYEAKPNKKFRINAHKVFLTYNQTNSMPELFFKILEEKFPGKIKRCVISREKHNNIDGWHNHVFLEFKDKINFKKKTAFDIELNGQIKHPEIKPVKDEIGYILYIAGFTKKKNKDKKIIFQFNIDVYKIYEIAKKKFKEKIKKEMTEKEKMGKIIEEYMTENDIEDIKDIFNNNI